MCPEAPELIVIAGPTAVGKTAVALELARLLDTEIISADSMQVYRHISIGTAKPSPQELQGVAYHLIDHVEPDHQYNLGDFISEAGGIIDSLRRRNRNPIICGGTGMYIRGLLYGVFDELSRDPLMRANLEAREQSEGLPALFAELHRIDPALTHVHAGDRQRILRALEVYYVTGRPLTQFHTQSLSSPIYRSSYFVLTMPRSELYRRIEHRVDAMMEAGLLEEARAYLAAGYNRNNPAMAALGYADLFRHLDGEITLEAALAAMKTRTRNYAKRQLTWFRSVPDAQWLDVVDKTPADVGLHIRNSLP